MYTKMCAEKELNSVGVNDVNRLSDDTKQKLPINTTSENGLSALVIIVTVVVVGHFCLFWHMMCDMIATLATVYLTFIKVKARKTRVFFYCCQ